MQNIFDSDGWLMRALSDLQMLVCLNLLTLLYSIPIITAGAALTAMHCVLMERIENDSRPLLSEYRRCFRRNLKTATPVWLILLFCFGILSVDYHLITGGLLPVPRLAAVPAILGMFACLAVFVYAIPLTARYENTTTATLRNAGILVITHIPGTFLAMVFLVVIPCLLFSVSRLMPLFFFAGISFPSYLQALLYMPVLKNLW